MEAAEKAPYQPILSEFERAAYAAAHRILMTDEPREITQYACPSMRRKIQVDYVAKVIMEHMQR